MSSYLSFETTRLLLQATTHADADFILELVNTPKWLQYIGDRQVHSLEDARQYIQTRMTPQLQRLGFANYTLIRKSDQTRIGTCGLYDREGLSGLDIGFALLPAYERQGYGYEAARRLLTAAHEDFGIQKISAITTPDNIASQRLLEKLGLRKTGTTQLPGEEEVLLVFEGG